MKKFVLVLALMLMGNVAFGGVVYEEHFDYADEAALDAAWFISWGADDFTLNTAVSSDGDGKSVTGQVASGTWIAQDFAIGGVGATDATISVDWYVDTAGGITPAGLQELYAPGFAGSVLAPGAGSGDYELSYYNGGYFPLGVSLVEGWNTVTVTVDGAGVLGFEVDGNTSAVTKDVGWGGLSGIRFFGGASPAVFDNIVVDVIPEPMTIGLLGIGGLLIRRKFRKQ